QPWIGPFCGRERFRLARERESTGEIPAHREECGSAKRIADASKPVMLTGKPALRRTEETNCADEYRSRLSCSLSSVEDERRNGLVNNASPGPSRKPVRLPGRAL